MKYILVILLFLSSLTALHSQTAITPFELNEVITDPLITVKIDNGKLIIDTPKTFVVVSLINSYTIYQYNCQIQIRVTGFMFIIIGHSITRFEDCTPIRDLEKDYFNDIMLQEIEKVFEH